jgi:hypothetical protein
MICNECNQEDMVEIWYGVPSIVEIMLAREDKVVLGGVYAKPFTHFCNACQNTYPAHEN